MHEGHAVELPALLWAAGWLVAVLVLFAIGLRLPLATGLGAIAGRLFATACVVAGLGVWGLANVALHLNDTHIDVTREKVYTPSATAMAVVDEVRTPVHITYFYRSDDPIGQRARNILEVMGRRNPLLTVLTVDPDKQPELARREGVRLYNAAIVEAAGRRGPRRLHGAPRGQPANHVPAGGKRGAAVLSRGWRQCLAAVRPWLRTGAGPFAAAFRPRHSTRAAGG